jgi:hypothetical protein
MRLPASVYRPFKIDCQGSFHYYLLLIYAATDICRRPYFLYRHFTQGNMLDRPLWPDTMNIDIVAQCRLSDVVEGAS